VNLRYIRNVWQENHQIYGHIRCIYTVMANTKYLRSFVGRIDDLWQPRLHCARRILYRHQHAYRIVCTVWFVWTLYALYIHYVYIQAGMCHTVIWDVQYGIISVNTEYAKVSHNRIFRQFWECRFSSQNGPISPQNHPKRSQFFSDILYVISILYNSIESSLKGRCFGGKCLKRPKPGKKMGKFASV